MTEVQIFLSIIIIIIYFISELLYYTEFDEMWVYTLCSKSLNIVSNSIKYYYNRKKPSKKIEEYLNNLTDLVDIKIYRDELNNTTQNVNQAKRRAYDRIIKRQDDKKAQEIIDDLDRKIEVLKELNVK